MNLIRLLILGLIFWLLYRMLSRLFDKPKQRQRVQKKTPGTDMVRCAHCGIHIPKNEALHSNGHDYCSEAHRNAGPKN